MLQSHTISNFILFQLKVYLHKQGEIPLVKDIGFALAPGMSFLIDVGVQKVT